MQVLYPRCCGLDVHKKSVVACVLITASDGTVHRAIRTFATMTAELLALDDWLRSSDVTHLAMESTGILWRPIFNILEPDRTVVLVNAQHIKAVPGRKTDVKDSEWLAELLRHGLLKPSFIPSPAIREVRDLTRYRKNLVNTKTQTINRLQKVLETANIKLSSVASNIVGTSGRLMLAAITAGEEDPQALAELAKGRLREKIPQLRLALQGHVQPYHRLLIGELLDYLEYLERSIHRLEVAIAQALKAETEALDLLMSIPAVGPVAGAAIVAEIGTDMSRFPSAKHLASWAGVCPGNKQSAGKRLSGTTTKGNGHLKAILCEVAGNLMRMPETALCSLYHRIARRRGKPRAMMAVAHSLLVSIFYMLKNHVAYQELGPEYFQRQDRHQLERRYVKRLEQLGFEVSLAPSAS
jgi:transposase